MIFKLEFSIDNDQFRTYKSDTRDVSSLNGPAIARTVREVSRRMISGVPGVIFAGGIYDDNGNRIGTYGVNGDPIRALDEDNCQDCGRPESKCVCDAGVI